MGKGNHNERRLHFVIYNIKWNDFKNVFTNRIIVQMQILEIGLKCDTYFVSKYDRLIDMCIFHI